MDDYDEALRETPRPLLAVVGVPAVHGFIERQSRKETVAYLCFKSSATFSLGKKKERRGSSSVESAYGAAAAAGGGILRAGWLHKHRHQMPAAVCLLFKWDDERSWRAQEAEQLADIDALKRQLRPRGIRLLIAIVHPPPASGDGAQLGGSGTPTAAAWEEKLASVRRRAELDSKQVVSVARDPAAGSGGGGGGLSEAGWARVERQLLELAQQHYKDEAARHKKEHTGPSPVAASASSAAAPASLSAAASSSSPSPSSAAATSTAQMMVRQHFKVAYYAELRRDSRAALKYYNSAYQYVKELLAYADARLAADPRGTALRLAELRSVAEYIHLRTISVYLAPLAPPPSAAAAAAAVTPAAAASGPTTIHSTGGGGSALPSTAAASAAAAPAAAPAVAAVAQPAAPGAASAGSSAAAAVSASSGGGGAVSDAVTQFGQHVRTFAGCPGPAADEYAHWAWMARQHQVFAEMLERTALPAGLVPPLPKLAYHNPAYHFLQAARFQQHRRRVAKRALEPLRELLLARFPPGGVESAPQAPYYVGVEPLPPAIASDPAAAHPLDPSVPAVELSRRDPASVETDMLQRSQARELHALAGLSEVVLRLLAQASTHAAVAAAPSNPPSTTGGASRLVVYIGTLQAEEYERCGQAARAKHLVERLLRAYHRDDWRLPLAHVLRLGRRCASRLGLNGETLDYSVLLLDPKLELEHGERADLQSDVVRLLNDTSDASLAEGRAVRMTGTHSIVELAVRFAAASLPAPGRVQLHLRLLSRMPLPIEAQSLLLRFNHPAYDCTVSHLPNTHAKETPTLSEGSNDLAGRRQYSADLLLLPGEARDCTIELDIASLDNAGVPSVDRNVLRCTEARLSVGPVARQLHLDWDLVADSPAVDSVPRGWEQQRTLRVSPSAPYIELDVLHRGPALYHDLHRVRFIIRNRGPELPSGGTLTVQLLGTPPPQAVALQQPGALQPGDVVEVHRGGALGRLQPFSLPALASGEEVVVDAAVVVGGVPGMRRLTSRLDFEPSQPPTQHFASSSVERSIDLAVQSPFVAAFTCFSSSYLPTPPLAGSLQVNQPFFLCMELQCNTPFPVIVHRVDLHVAESSKGGPPMATCSNSTAGTGLNGLPAVVLRDETKFAIWYELVALVHGQHLELGHVTIVWSRDPSARLPSLSEPEEHQPVTISIPIPTLNIQIAPLSGTVEVPSFAVVGSVTPLSIAVHNRTDLPQELRLRVHENGAFLFSGDKSATFSVLPRSTHQLRYHLLPLQAGRQSVPHVEVIASRSEKELQTTKAQRFIFVQPSKEVSRHLRTPSSGTGTVRSSGLHVL